MKRVFVTFGLRYTNNSKYFSSGKLDWNRYENDFFQLPRKISLKLLIQLNTYYNLLVYHEGVVAVSEHLLKTNL